MRVWLGLMVIGGLLVGATVARSQAPSPMAPAEHKTMAPNDIQWGDPPPVFVKSARFAVLYGDPTKPNDAWINADREARRKAKLLAG